MRPPGTPAQLERRRRRAVQLVKSGRALSAVARQVHASVSSVFRIIFPLLTQEDRIARAQSLYIAPRGPYAKSREPMRSTATR